MNRFECFANYGKPIVRKLDLRDVRSIRNFYSERILIFHRLSLSRFIETSLSRGERAFEDERVPRWKTYPAAMSRSPMNRVTKDKKKRKDEGDEKRSKVMGSSLVSSEKVTRKRTI